LTPFYKVNVAAGLKGLRRHLLFCSLSNVGVSLAAIQMGKRTHSHAFEGGKRHPPDKLAPAAGGTLAILGLDGCGRTTPARRINTPLELQGGELSSIVVQPKTK